MLGFLYAWELQRLPARYSVDSAQSPHTQPRETYNICSGSDPYRFDSDPDPKRDNADNTDPVKASVAFQLF